ASAMQRIISEQHSPGTRARVPTRVGVAPTTHCDRAYPLLARVSVPILCRTCITTGRARTPTQSLADGRAQHLDDPLLVLRLALREERQSQCPAGDILSRRTQPLPEAVPLPHIRLQMDAGHVLRRRDALVTQRRHH